jgi:hypothetical protein
MMTRLLIGGRRRIDPEVPCEWYIKRSPEAMKAGWLRPQDGCKDGDKDGHVKATWMALKGGSSSVVERQLPKLNVAGSIPVSRSRFSKHL